MMGRYGLIPGSGGGGGGAANAIEDTDGIISVGDLTAGQVLAFTNGLIESLSRAGIDTTALQTTGLAQIAALASKSALVSADKFLLEDSEASGALKELSYSDLLSNIEDDISVEGGGATVLASYTVSGSAKQTINFGPGGDAYTSGTFPTGRRYCLRARIKPGTPANTNSYDLRPNSLTTNLFSQYHGAASTGASANRVATGGIGGTSSDVEEFVFDIQWDELAGFDRFFRVDSDAYDNSATLVEYTYQYRLVWAQTPAEDVLDNLVFGTSQADGFGIGSVLTLIDMGPCV